MQGGHGGYGHGGYGYGYGYDAGASAGGYGGGYDAGAAYGYDSAAGYGGYYSSSTGGYPSSAYEDPVAAAGRRAHGLPAPPLDGLELQSSEACPRNYVIFDQTPTDSRVTFHHSLAHRLGGGSSSGQHDDGSSCYGGAGKEADDDAEEEIDALLLSSEDDDAASSSPDSACSSSRGGGAGKKGRVKKMMRTLKGIVPGAGQMDTPAALDEAVRYLKSLKLDATNKLVGARRSSDR